MITIDGKATSLEIQEELKVQTEKLRTDGKPAPHLAAIIVGNNPASRVYVGHKIKACERIGFDSTLIELSDNVTEDELLQRIDELNTSPNINGFIVQLPLPQHLDELAVIRAIHPDKDVDGFHPINAGRLSLGLDGFAPATPAGVMELIRRYGIETSGKSAVVVGRSHIVGTPMTILLSRPGIDATVTICHSKTTDLTNVVRQADIIVAAVGRPGFITKEMVKPGAVIIDVGINRIEDMTRKSGTRLVGDVDPAAAERASAMTPVPGGVGPMTIAALLMNTMKAYKHQQVGR